MGNKGKRFLALVCVCTLLLGSAVGCSRQQSSGPQLLKIGAAVSLSGALAREGGLMKHGYELWRDVVNQGGGISIGGTKRPVEIVFYDDKSDASTAAKLIEKLITEDKVDFIFGPYGSGITAAVSAISEKYKKVMIAPMANADEVYARGFQYLFGLLPPVSRGLGAHIDLMLTLDPAPKTLAVVWPDDLFPASAARAAIKRAEEAGLSVVLAEKYPKGTKDLAPLLARIKEKAPDALITAGYFEDSMLLVKTAREMQVNLKYLGNVDLPLHKDFVDVLGKYADYIYGASTWWVPSVSWQGPVIKESSEYVRLYKEKYGDVAVTHFSASATAAGVVLQVAIEKAGSVDTEKVRAELRNGDLETFFGKVRYDEKGSNVAGTGLVIQLQGGKPVVVWPEEVKQGNARYPMPAWDKR